MDILQIVVLAVVQGLTEFLPISSSAHLVLVPFLTHWPDQGIVFDIAVHLGSLLAVMCYFQQDVRRMFAGKVALLQGKWHTENARLVVCLALSTLPLLVVGVVVKDVVTHWGRLLPVLASTSIVFGLLLWWVDKKSVQKYTSINVVSFKHALIFGCFQALSVIPGTSRSGICATAGRWLGYNREVASRYASLMAMPVILILATYTIVAQMETVAAPFNWQQNPKALLLGVVLSFLAALAGIHLLMRLVVRLGFGPFVVYRVVLGVVLWGVVIYG